MEEAKYILMDGKAIPFSEAKVHVLAPAITYAAMVFEGVRGYWSEPKHCMYVFRLKDHMQRLQESMQVMRYDAHYTIEELCAQVIEAIQINNFRKTIHMRVMAMVTGTPSITTSSPVSLVVTVGTYPFKDWQQTGMAVNISSWQRVHDSANPPRVKASANYSNGRLGMMQAQLDGYHATLMLTRDGKVAESPLATLFMVRKGRLVTPASTESILESITRETLIDLVSKEFGIEVEQRPVDRTELYSAEELFFCGSGWEVVPISSVDRLPVADGHPGPLTKCIRDLYLDVVIGKRKEYKKWLTVVKYK
jgi:branched-chain amino acid aminotransferase